MAKLLSLVLWTFSVLFSNEVQCGNIRGPVKGYECAGIYEFFGGCTKLVVHSKGEWANIPEHIATALKPLGGGQFVNPAIYGGYGSLLSSFRRFYFDDNVPYNFTTPGYGTNFGTRFPGGIGAYGGEGFSPKRLGLGATTEGFLEEAMTSPVVISVYHRYMMYKHLMSIKQKGTQSSAQLLFSEGAECLQGCPEYSHCQFGYCECDQGIIKTPGGCTQPKQITATRNLDMVFKTCNSVADCHEIDLNMVCLNQTENGGAGMCGCRENFQWNDEKSECEFYLVVDCSSITYETPVSFVVDSAANISLAKLKQSGESAITLEDLQNGRNFTSDEILATSMLTNINPGEATEAEIKEAFCRDVDTFSWEFGEYEDLQRKHEEIILTVIALVCAAILLLILYYLRRRRMANNNRDDNVNNDINME